MVLYDIAYYMINDVSNDSSLEEISGILEIAKLELLK